jgi:IS30 family transposase
VRGWRMSGGEKAEIWRRVRAGQTSHEIAAALGRSQGGVAYVIGQRGWVSPREPAVASGWFLSISDREEVSRGIIAGESARAIAARLGRSASTISREISRNGGRSGYRAVAAERATRRRGCRPKPAKLVRCARLRGRVEAMLMVRWSPQQIAATLRREHPDEPEMWVSHETIYQSLFIQGRGALRRELAACLRTGRAVRQPRSRLQAKAAKGKIRDLVPISERPAEADDRAVPGHWEGDLMIGRYQRSAVATLVERSSRFVMVVALPQGHSAPAVRDALTERIQTLPAQLRRTLTWDRGTEMAQHVTFTVDTGVAVYFCDPHSPWQRGSNENTNGLLRQYFPKGTDFSRYTQAQLDDVANELNGRPRQTLAWLNPAEKLAQLVQ